VADHARRDGGEVVERVEAQKLVDRSMAGRLGIESSRSLTGATDDDGNPRASSPIASSDGRTTTGEDLLTTTLIVLRVMSML